MEKCSDCQRVFREIKNEHPGWSLTERLSCVAETLKTVRESSTCNEKDCLPLKQAERMLLQIEKHKSIPPGPEPYYLQRAREVVNMFILDQIKGQPDLFTAYSRAMRCGCDSCVREYNQWIDLYAGNDPELLKLKKPLRGEKHVIYNSDSYSGV